MELALGLGATHAVDARVVDSVEAVRRLTDGGADYVIEAAGLTRTIEQAFSATRRGGLCVFASHPAAGETIRLDPYELIAGKRIRGSWGGAARPDDDVPRLSAAFLDGQLPLAGLLGRHYALEDINMALSDLEAARVIRPLIAIDPNL